MSRRLAMPLVFVCLLSAGCGLFGPSGEIQYDITGTATRVDVTYENSSGGTSQATNAAVPWTYSWSGGKSGDFLYVSAQIVNTSGGSITVSIKKNGKLFKSGTASGFAAIATASGSY